MPVWCCGLPVQLLLRRSLMLISDSVEEVRDCKNQLKNNDNDSYDLKKRTKEFELLCDVVKVSAKYLEGDTVEVAVLAEFLEK
ncbi:hypothetical protein RHGRI_020578 [Rhododendron griersonianum]|uniref:Uncharacterized protein n=1 Tax=Rhododendron griersonianum TaxID=479676 RepID=A0AAV6JGX4_9ERIC|nr:hypothetical protein RHGRI_020578 [Rhododendron griersonianum]